MDSQAHSECRRVVRQLKKGYRDADYSFEQEPIGIYLHVLGCDGCWRAVLDLEKRQVELAIRALYVDGNGGD